MSNAHRRKYSGERVPISFGFQQELGRRGVADVRVTCVLDAQSTTKDANPLRFSIPIRGWRTASSTKSSEAGSSAPITR